MQLRFSDVSVDSADADMVAVSAGTSFKTELAELDRRFDGHLLPWLAARGFSGRTGTSTSFPSLGRIKARELVVVGHGARQPTDLRAAACKAGREARDAGAKSLALSLGALDSAALRPVIECALAGNYTYDRYRRETERTAALEVLDLLGAEGSGEEAQIRAYWQSFARDLVNGPAAEVYPETLANAASALAKRADLADIEVEIWDAERCKKEGCVGITAVGQGAARPPYLIRVTYAPKGAKGHVALVGKGVTFDSGGLSLKPSAGMQTMRCDMAGGATALATIAAVSALRLPVEVDAWVAAVENMNDGNSYKLGDVLTYSNGVTVEIHNTDAEGRLVLADALIRACKRPGVTHVVDIATLTGACAVALGPDFAGLFTDDDALATSLLGLAATEGEGLWRLPLHAPYKSMLKAEWAQMKNVGGRDGGATTAALFLQSFVENVAWAHLDIAPSAFYETASGGYAAGATGQMVRTLTSWVASKG